RIRQPTLNVSEQHNTVDLGALNSTADYTLPQIEQALSYSKDTADDTWVENIQENASKIRELTVESRRELLKHPDRVSTTGSILPKTETLRWLERSSHHIWRICNYLVVGRGSHE